MSAALQDPQRHLVTADEFQRMGEAGVFEPDARLELIEGEIIEMPPIGPPHSGRVNTLTRLFIQRAGDRAVVSVQHPAVVSDRSVPQPDLALLAARSDDYATAHPRPADVLLLVEVSDTTLRFDLHRKVPLYARCGIPEVWVVDVNDSVIRVFRDPAGGGYRTSFVAGPGDRVACGLMPEVFVESGEIFRELNGWAFDALP